MSRSGRAAAGCLNASSRRRLRRLPATAGTALERPPRGACPGSDDHTVGDHSVAHDDNNAILDHEAACRGGKGGGHGGAAWHAGAAKQALLTRHAGAAKQALPLSY